MLPGVGPTMRPLPRGLGCAPALVMAPMVKQSDRAFRALVRCRGGGGGSGGETWW